MKKLITLLAAAPLCLSAQDLTTTIDVDHTVVPVEIQASPLAGVRMNIQQSAPALSPMSTADYAGEARIEASSDSIAFAYPSQLPPVSEYRGYVAGAYGPTYNLGVQAGYALVRDSLTDLSLSGSYSGTSYLTRAAAVNRTAADNSISAALRFNRRMGRVLMEADASYIYSSVKSPWNDISRTNDLNLADARVRLYSHGRRIDWEARAGWDYAESGSALDAVGDKTGGSYNSNFNVGGDLWWHRGRRHHGFLLKMDFFAGMEKSTYASAYDPIYRDTSYYGNVLLGWRWLRKHFRAEVGVRTDMFSDGAVFLRIHPIVDLQWTPKGWLSIFASTHSDIRPGSLRQAYDYSHFLPGNYAAGINYRFWIINIGLNLKPLPGLEVKAKVRYNHSDGALGIYSGDAPEIPYDISSDVCTNWSFDGVVRYSHPWHSITASVEYRHYFGEGHDLLDFDNMDCARDALSIGLQGKITDALTARATFSYRNDRSTLGYRSMWLEDMAKLDLSAYYELNKRLTVGLALNNITNREWLVLPGISCQGFTAVALAQYKF